MLRLHDSLTSGNGYKVRLLLAQLGKPYQRLEYDLDKRETRTPEFLGKNPNGRVPLLELDDGTFLAESNAIIWFLAEGSAEGSPFLPAAGEHRLRAEVMQWLFFEQYSHEPNIATVRFWLTHKTPVTPLIELSIPAKRANGHAALAVMEGHLATRTFFVAERYGLADIALFAYTHVAGEGGFDLAPYPAVRAWIERVAAQPRHVPITQG